MSEREFARILRPGGGETVTRYAPGEVGVLASERGEAVQDSVKRAFEQGVAAGEQRAKEATAMLVEQQNRLLTALVQEIRRLHDCLLRDADDLVAGVALDIAEKVIREQVDAFPDLVVAQVRVAVARLKEGGPIRVEAHPDDVPLLQAARESIEKAFDGTVSLHIEPCATVARGGCHVETPARVVDARLEAQLLRLGHALRRPLSRG